MPDHKAAWQDYERRLSCLWRSMGAIFLAFGLGAALGLLVEFTVQGQVPRIMFFLVMSPVFVTFAYNMYCQVQVYSFRCPECKKRFAYHWLNTWPSRTCKHCGCKVGYEPPPTMQQLRDNGEL